MRVFTNMAWPDDPYGTGRQVYRRTQPPMLAAFAVQWVNDGDQALLVSAAMVYLRLHRTHPVALDPATIQFGFRCVVPEHTDETGQLITTADLDLLQARRHAAVLTGHSLLADLHRLAKASALLRRGISAVEADWTQRRTTQRNLAQMIDTADTKLAGDDLLHRCLWARIEPHTAPHCLALPIAFVSKHQQGDPDAQEWLALATVEKALIVALTASRLADRCRWVGRTDISQLLAATAWDAFPSFAPLPE
ncbi:hypothetical protein [Streptosporangium saharense]|uniref:hypothetical protein n=1 Tax=Streptosporangium saharense TaxID=1706840 RepID=UPI00368AB314